MRRTRPKRNEMRGDVPFCRCLARIVLRGTIVVMAMAVASVVHAALDTATLDSGSVQGISTPV